MKTFSFIVLTGLLCIASSQTLPSGEAQKIKSMVTQAYDDWQTIVTSKSTDYTGLYKEFEAIANEAGPYIYQASPQIQGWAKDIDTRVKAMVAAGKGDNAQIKIIFQELTNIYSKFMSTSG